MGGAGSVVGANGGAPVGDAVAGAVGSASPSGSGADAGAISGAAAAATANGASSSATASITGLGAHGGLGGGQGGGFGATAGASGPGLTGPTSSSPGGLPNGRVGLWSVGPNHPSFSQLVEAGGKADLATKSALSDLPQLPQPIMAPHPISSAPSQSNATAQAASIRGAFTGREDQPGQVPDDAIRVHRRHFHPHRRTRMRRRNIVPALQTTIVTDN